MQKHNRVRIQVDQKIIPTNYQLSGGGSRLVDSKLKEFLSEIRVTNERVGTKEAAFYVIEKDHSRVDDDFKASEW